MNKSLPVYRARGPRDRLKVEPPERFPGAMLNVTNRCNLTCSHCFVYTDGNPNDPADDIPDDQLLAELERVRDRHGIFGLLWMGGEPMIRWRLLERGVKLFQRNVITTNGTIPLKDFGPSVTYVVSLDGPEDLNDPVRGQGVYARVKKTLASVPDDFAPTVQIQCVVTKQNQHRLEELVLDFIDSQADGMTFTFHVPNEGEVSELAWRDVEERESAVDAVMALKRRYPSFVWNSSRALELMRPATARLVTDRCPALSTVLPLYVERGAFSNPKCCYGNNADCDRCGGWVVFAHAAKLPGPWDDLVPPDREPGPLAMYFMSG
ncbi:MAG: radical SAM protein [Myxococcales bacterium]|nr:radical SAM protein [Myxococcales bacterium]MCL4748867.1 radical SAM protein [Myxococcales bacterium]